jgi:hypothetical protein
MTSQPTRNHNVLARAGLLGMALCLFLSVLPGCSTVKFVQRNPYTGEIWTVYEHGIGPDTVTYCPPNDGSNCMEAQFIDSMPPSAGEDAPRATQ